jgi:hypothetical protein
MMETLCFTDEAWMALVVALAPLDSLPLLKGFAIPCYLYDEESK